MKNTNFWLEKHRKRVLTQVLPDVLKHFNMTTNEFMSKSQDEQDELIGKYQKSLKKTTKTKKAS